MLTQNNTGYAVGGSDGTGLSASEDEKTSYWSIGKLKRSYQDYVGSKREEIDEQQDARRFVHGSHWTSEEITQLNLRKQPLVWNNKTKRKINGIVGTIQRLKQDPKAYPRTPKHEQGAELATASIRYALERVEWDRKDPIAAEMAAIDGIGGVEFNLAQGKKGDIEVDLDYVWIDGFFYDPRSRADDFSDAGFLGVAKWLTLEQAVEMFPENEDELNSAVNAGEDLTTDSDFDNRSWFSIEGEIKRIRLVEEWYRHKGKWCWCIYTGANKLKEGASPFVNEDGDSEHKYEMFSAYTDQDGDRYGFVRDLKPLNREINMRRSKALYTMLSRRIITPVGAFDDVEVARREAARSDGVVVYNPGPEKPEFDDTNRVAETEAQFKFLEDIKSDFESFGPNVAVTGEGLENSSGRAIHLLQQAGLADLGPFLQSYRGWKIRVYRKMWNAIQRHWEGERWIRVTDDENLGQFIQINGVDVDPMTGMPTLVNAIGELDVDIILDEGPDSINMMGDAYDTLTALAAKGAELPPAVLIELSPLQASVKQKLLKMINPEEPSPEQQLQMKNAEAEIAEKASSAKLNEAKTFETMQNAMNPEGGEGGGQAEMMKAEMEMSLEEKKHRDETILKMEEMRMKREEMQAQLALKREEMQLQTQMKREDAETDRRFKREEADKDRQIKVYDSEMNRRQKAEDSEANRKAKAEEPAKAAIQVKHSAEEIAGPIADVIENNNTVMQELMQSIVQMQKEERAEHRAFMEMFSKKMTAPKRIIRGKDGRAAGVETLAE